MFKNDVMLIIEWVYLKVWNSISYLQYVVSYDRVVKSLPVRFFQLGRHPSKDTCIQWSTPGTAGQIVPTGCCRILWCRPLSPEPGGQNIPGSTALTRRYSCVWDQLMRYLCLLLSYSSRQHNNVLCSIRCHNQSMEVGPVHIISCIDIKSCS